VRKPLALPGLSSGLGQAGALKSWGDGGSSKQRPAGQRGTAKSCKLLQLGPGRTPSVTPEKTGAFGDPAGQNKESEGLWNG
jgi:hypothetical protein